MLNSHSPYSRGWKSAIRPGNLQYITDKLNDTMAYLDKLQLPSGKHLKDSARNTFIIGLHTAMESMTSISKTLFTEHPAHYPFILAYRFNQDHIETLFSKIRAKGGFNNNPNTLQFKYALRALLMKNDISPGSNANCLELDVRSDLFKASKPLSTEDFDNFSSESSLVLDLNSLPTPVVDITEYIGK